MPVPVSKVPDMLLLSLKVKLFPAVIFEGKLITKFCIPEKAMSLTAVTFFSKIREEISSTIGDIPEKTTDFLKVIFGEDIALIPDEISVSALTIQSPVKLAFATVTLFIVRLLFCKEITFACIERFELIYVVSLVTVTVPVVFIVPLDAVFKTDVFMLFVRMSNIAPLFMRISSRAVSVEISKEAFSLIINFFVFAFGVRAKSSVGVT